MKIAIEVVNNGVDQPMPVYLNGKKVGEFVCLRYSDSMSVDDRIGFYQYPAVFKGSESLRFLELKAVLEALEKRCEFLRSLP